MSRFLVGTQAQLGVSLFAALSAYRYEVFVRQMGWALPASRPGCERDQFDTDRAVYVVCLDASGQIVGCGRLLPTMHAYLLAQMFPHLVRGDLPRSATTWELSRFSAARMDGGRAEPGLGTKLFEMCLRVAGGLGATDLVGVLSVVLERWCRISGFTLQQLGDRQSHEGGPLVACAIKVPLEFRRHTPNARAPREDAVGISHARWVNEDYRVHTGLPL
jgi:acyl homoserine lactone synthase